jgi:hypothetical protein
MEAGSRATAERSDPEVVAANGDRYGMRSIARLQFQSDVPDMAALDRVLTDVPSVGNDHV